MARPNKDDSKRSSSPWQRKLSLLIAQHRFAQALKLLDSVIEQQMPLFRSDVTIRADRRLAWLYRIELLRSRGRLSEALAWTCLECELNPSSVTARALKERLKRDLDLGSSPDGSPSGPSPRSKTAWEGVAGMRELKAILERDVILPLQEPELYRQYKVSLPNGILLYGPPGCGKTFIARKLSELLDFEFIDVKPSDLGSIYIHGSQGKIAALFDDARSKAPCLIFIDELDALMPSRGGDLYHSYATEVNEFLTQLNESAKSRLLIVGATNRLEKIDSAVLRPGRFDKKVYVGTPDVEARVELLRQYMTDRPQDAVDWLMLANECEGYTCAEIEFVVNEAARRALNNRRHICQEDLMAELAANSPAHATDLPVDDEHVGED